MSPNSQRGISLVLVLVVIGVASVVLYNETYRRTTQLRDRQLQYSVAQTEYVLNLVYAYYQKQRRWPVSKRDCETPDQFLAWNNAPYNGWGYQIRGANNICDENALSKDYVLSQIVPEQWVEEFGSHFTEVKNDYPNNGEAGTRRVEIVLNRSGGALRDIAFENYSLYANSQPEIPSLTCSTPDGSPVSPLVVVGQSGACGSRSTYSPDPQPDGNDRNVYTGFRIRLNGERVYYDFMATYESSSESGGLESTWDDRDPDPPGFNDGLQNADESCPKNTGKRINVAILTWCP